VNLFSAVAGLLKPAPPPDPKLAEALARVASRVDPVLRAAHHFDHRLSAPLAHTLGYCAGLVDALPGPITIDRQAFSGDPLVHALFATAGDIEEMLGRSQAVRDFLETPESWQEEHFHALLVARHREKQQLGMKRRGELIENDVPQRVLFFSDHTLIAPRSEPEDLREQLRGMALESLLRSFQTHLDALRHERDGLRADASVKRTHLGVLNGAPGRDIETRTRHLDELDARLRQIAESLMPDPLLDALGDFLLKPESALRLTPFSISVDRLGIIRDPADDASVQTLNFPEFMSRDQRLHLAMLVRISRAEAIEAVEAMRDRQRRFMII